MSAHANTQSKWTGFAHLMRLDKPVGTYLLLWPTLWALMIAAGGLPPLDITVIFIAGVFVMRSAGCVINDYADRNVDGAVKRTSQRPLVTGAVTQKEALGLFSLLIITAFCLVLLLNVKTIALSVIALLLASSYPFMKRYTHLPQVVLGAAFGWSIPMAFMAVSEQIPVWGWLLFFANLAWTVAYDTMYAMVDRDDDLKVGIKSTAILFGRFDVLIIMTLQLVMLALLFVVGKLIDANLGYWSALGVIAVLLVRHYTQIKDRQRDACFKAFKENHYVGMVLTIGLLVDTLLF